MACARHPEVAETGRCTACDERWCEACLRPLRTSSRAACPACGHLVVKASPVLAGGDQLRDAVRRVASVEGLTTATAFAIAFAASRWLPIFAVFYAAAVVGYYFFIIHHVGDGGDGLPGPSDAVDSWTENIGLVLRGLAIVVIGGLPVYLWFVVTHDLPRPAVALALVALGQLYVPAAILAVAITNQTFAAVWPPTWFAVIRRAPGAYSRFALRWLATVAIGLVIVAITSPLVDGSLGLARTSSEPLATYGLGALAASFVWNLFVFAQAVLVGLFLRENRDAFDMQ
jgi:hypothetical protein